VFSVCSTLIPPSVSLVETEFAAYRCATRVSAAKADAVVMLSVCNTRISCWG
jgi:dihydroxyacid dehydratase/phosphogluconate dehydratase